MTAAISGTLYLSWQHVYFYIADPIIIDSYGIFCCLSNTENNVQIRMETQKILFLFKVEQCPLQSIYENHSQSICLPYINYLTPFQIIFYEGRNYQGRHWECSNDCMDTFRYFNCCNSIRVSGGHWVTYERPNYMGYQYILGPGEYPDYHHWMGFNNCIRSCQMLPPVSQSNRQIGLVVPQPPTAHLVHQILLWEWMSISGLLMSFTDSEAGHSIKFYTAKPTRRPSQPLKGIWYTPHKTWHLHSNSASKVDCLPMWVPNSCHAGKACRSYLKKPKYSPEFKVEEICSGLKAL